MVEGDEKKPKTPAQLKKEADKAEKMTKFAEKQRKLAEQKAQQAAKGPEVLVLCSNVFMHNYHLQYA